MVWRDTRKDAYANNVTIYVLIIKIFYLIRWIYVHITFNIIIIVMPTRIFILFLNNYQCYKQTRNSWIALKFLTYRN